MEKLRLASRPPPTFHLLSSPLYAPSCAPLARPLATYGFMQGLLGSGALPPPEGVTPPAFFPFPAFPTLRGQSA